MTFLSSPAIENLCGPEFLQNWTRLTQSHSCGWPLQRQRESVSVQQAETTWMSQPWSFSAKAVRLWRWSFNTWIAFPWMIACFYLSSQSDWLQWQMTQHPESCSLFKDFLTMSGTNPIGGLTSVISLIDLCLPMSSLSPNSGTVRLLADQDLANIWVGFRSIVSFMFHAPLLIITQLQPLVYRNNGLWINVWRSSILFDFAQ